MHPHHRPEYKRQTRWAALTATAVAAVGLLAPLADPDDLIAYPERALSFADTERTPAQDAAKVLRDATQHPDAAALLLPADDEAQRAADWWAMDVLPNLQAQGPRAMHAQRAWACVMTDRHDPLTGQVEPLPVFLHNPLHDAQEAAADAWQILPQGPGLLTDRAIAPLVNADYQSLSQWVASV